MKCPKCGSDNREGIKFCEECGEKMEMTCPECGTKIVMGKNFCGECGHKLIKSENKPHKESELDYSKPQSYTPQFLADRIIKTRTSIEGERKLVTVLFLDVANFTGMSEKLDPEEVHEIMDGAFKILMDEIHKVEGTINQFTGDGVMALFGAPLAHEGHSQRACYASLAIQKAIRVYGKKVRQNYGVDFRVRIGLNSGPVVVGAIGDDLRMDYTAIGDTTNMAARMESMADPGSILLTSHTHGLAKEYFQFRDLGKLPVKGKKEPQEVYELLSASRAVTRLDASVAKGLTRYIGRRNEIETLITSYEKALTGSGQVVGIIGEAGVGKSRLIYELRNRLTDDHLYLEGRCLQYGGSIPFLPLLDILRSLFVIQEGDPGEIIKKRMTEIIEGFDEKLLGAFPAFQDILCPPSDDETWHNLEPKEKRNRTFEAIRDLLIRSSQSRPLVLVLDDLHWIDKTSEEFLDYFIGWLTNTRILMLLIYRPEYTHPWASRSYYDQIRLDQLSSVTSAELIHSILPGKEIVPEITNLILNRAAGNPLFMEELTKTLLENGSIRKTDQKYILSVSPSEVHVPDTVQGIIAARMDRLEDHIKRTMQVASVIGRDFAYRILQTITGAEEELKSYLLSLQNLEFIYEKSLFPELEYIFRHALTQEVAYSSILLRKRKELHELIGRAIEQIYGERLEELLETLAYHYSRSDNFEKAYHYTRLSGDKAIGKHSAWEALGCYKEALKALNDFPDSGEKQKSQMEILHLILVPIIILGFPEESLSILEEGATLAKELGDTKSLMRFYGNMGLYYSRMGNHAEGKRCAEKAFNGAEEIHDIDAMAQSGPDLSISYSAEGDYENANDVALRVTRAIEKTGRQIETFGGPTNIYSVLSGMRGANLARLGHFEEARVICEKALSEAVKINRPITLGLCENYVGMIHSTRGQGEPAKDRFEKGIRYLEEVQFLQPLSTTWTDLGYAHFLLGEPDAGIEFAKKGLGIQTQSGSEWFRTYHHRVLGICFFEKDEHKQAIEQMEEACQLADKNSEKHHMGIALTWLGRILGQSDSSDPNGALKHISKGISILEALKTTPDLAVGYLFLGELFALSGRKEEALDPLKKAEGMFLKMKMEYWPEKTRKILGALQS
jgi:class 3 adenylate cyclase/tetratricopeptide (TPR) repeat protein